MKPLHPTTLTAQILMFLAHQDGKWCTWGQGFYMPSVQQVFPVSTSEKVQFRFMRMLQNQGLVGGCDCGCRGDYVPTVKGLFLLSEDSVNGEQELKRWEKNLFFRVLI